MNNTSGGGIAMWHILSHMQLSIQSLLKLLNRLLSKMEVSILNLLNRYDFLHQFRRKLQGLCNFERCSSFSTLQWRQHANTDRHYLRTIFLGLATSKTDYFTKNFTVFTITVLFLLWVIQALFLSLWVSYMWTVNLRALYNFPSNFGIVIDKRVSNRFSRLCFI